MRALGILVAVAGCSFQGAPIGSSDGQLADGHPDLDGTLASDATPNPDGTSGADAITADAAMVDTDGDGIADSVDNCPTVFNPGQENEDGDRFGDICDPCPPIADNNPPDADGDGVADACDPRPTTPGDKIAVFAGFAHGVPAGFSQSGTWSGVNDLSATTTGPAWLTSPFTAPVGETVSAALIIDAVTVNPAGFGVVDTHANNDSGVSCVGYIAGTNNGLAVALDDGTSSAVAPLAVAVGSAFTISLRRSANNYTCAVGAAQVTKGLTLPAGGTGAGLRLVGGTARYHWLMIVTN